MHRAGALVRLATLAVPAFAIPRGTHPSLFATNAPTAAEICLLNATTRHDSGHTPPLSLQNLHKTRLLRVCLAQPTQQPTEGLNPEQSCVLPVAATPHQTTNLYNCSQSFRC